MGLNDCECPYVKEPSLETRVNLLAETFGACAILVGEEEVADDEVGATAAGSNAVLEVVVLEGINAVEDEDEDEVAAAAATAKAGACSW